MTSALSVAGLSSLMAASLALLAHPATAAALKLEECRLQHPERLASFEARCGALEVGENPDDASGRKIRLRVAVVPALNRRGATDPLFVLAGGPGQASSDFYATAAPAFTRVHRDRDIVLLDQRGTGESNPLKCDYPDEEELAELDAAQIQHFTRRCLDSIQGDPRYYTTSVAVRDLDAVRAALGYERVNLYGVSYGTRVAQHYLRRYPQRTRSVILDGVVPPEQILGIDSALIAERALERIFERCGAEPACHAAFADPAGQFLRLRNDLARKPAEIALAEPTTGTVVRMPFRLAHLQVAVRLLSYAPDRAALLPLLLDQAVEQRNLAPLAAQARMISDRLSDAIATGMHNAVVCTEDAPFFDTSAIDRGALAQTYLGTIQLDGLVEMCKVWPRGVLDPDFHAPLVSAVPVLLLSGSADPVTPPEYAERARASLRNARHVVLDGQGHGQLAVGCVPRVMAEFLSLGSLETLDTTCTKNAAPAPFFTSFSGPAP